MTFVLSFLETALGGPLYSLDMGDDGADGRQEILPAVQGRDQILVYRRAGLSLVPESATPPRFRLTAAPNPVARRTVLRYAGAGLPDAARVEIYDVTGGCLRRIPLSTAWPSGTVAIVSDDPWAAGSIPRVWFRRDPQRADDPAPAPRAREFSAWSFADRSGPIRFVQHGGADDTG